MYIDTERMSATQENVKGVQAILAFLSFVEVHENGQKQVHQINEAILKNYQKYVEMFISEDAALNKEKCTFQYSGITFNLKDDIPNWASLVKLVLEKNTETGKNRLLFTTGKKEALLSGNFYWVPCGCAHC
jgi:hypothetical protein